MTEYSSKFNYNILMIIIRIYDVAGTSHVLTKKGSGGAKRSKPLRVYVDGQKISVDSFQKYAEMCSGMRANSLPREEEEEEDEETAASSNVPPKLCSERIDDPDSGISWEIVATLSEDGFSHCSFVNSINTRRGGTHVNYVANVIAKHLCGHINGTTAAAKKKRKGKSVTVTTTQVKQHLALWVNAQIHNPQFDSQTKETLTTQKKEFGFLPTLSASFLKSLTSKSCGIVQAALRLAKFKTKKNIVSVARRLTHLRGIKKLDDANNAGTSKSHQCTLILTEGDSAKTLAVAGIVVLGRDNFGVFPLKGKPLNPRAEGDAKVRKNEELTNIVKILGIDRRTVYTAEKVRKLRYGSVMIMADQDPDGSHIKGLIINFLHWYNPSLLKCRGFLKQFITPLIRATKGKQVRTFFTASKYLEWQRSQLEAGAAGKQWKIKYYKGLGTSTTKEAKEYFSNLGKHCLKFRPMTDVGGSASPAKSRRVSASASMAAAAGTAEDPMEIDGATGSNSGVVVDLGAAAIDDSRWSRMSDAAWIKLVFGKGSSGSNAANRRKEWLTRNWVRRLAGRQLALLFLLLLLLSPLPLSDHQPPTFPSRALFLRSFARTIIITQQTNRSTKTT